MATLDAKTLAQARQVCARLGTVDYDKLQINAALQAVEDTLTSAAAKTALSNAINTATSPKTLTTPQKLAIIKSVVVKLSERWT